MNLSRFVIRNVCGSPGTSRDAPGGAARFRWLCCAGSFVFLSAVVGCSSQQSSTSGDRGGIDIPSIQKQLRTAASSAVGVVVETKYRTEVFYHDLVNGELVADTTSVTGFRLKPGKSGVSTSEKHQDVFGGGLLIYQDPKRALVLTSQHVVMNPDTISTYCLDSAGNPTGALFSQAIKVSAVHQVIALSGRRRPAEVITVDQPSDLGLLSVGGEGSVGVPFADRIASDEQIEWGELVFAFGAPRGVKQLTVGITSPSPYPGTFALDAATRFGFSGGPVFVLERSGELLLAGIVRGALVTRLQYVAPPADAAVGESLTKDDLEEMKVGEYTSIDYGIAYSVDARSVVEFLEKSATLLLSRGIALPSRLLKSK